MAGNFRVMDIDGVEFGGGFDSFRAAVKFGDKLIAKDKSFRVKGNKGGSEEIDPLFRRMMPRYDAIAELSMEGFIPGLKLNEEPATSKTGSEFKRYNCEIMRYDR